MALSALDAKVVYFLIHGCFSKAKNVRKRGVVWEVVDQVLEVVQRVCRVKCFQENIIGGDHVATVAGGI